MKYVESAPNAHPCPIAAIDLNIPALFNGIYHAEQRLDTAEVLHRRGADVLTGCFVGVGCAGSTGRYASAAPAGTPATIKSSSFICAVGALCNGEGACAASAAPEASSATAHTTEDCIGDRCSDRRISQRGSSRGCLCLEC